MKALQCPFLSRLPVSVVSKNAPALLTVAADKCPIMQHAVHYGKMAAGNGDDFQGVVSKCPYSQHKMSTATSAAVSALVGGDQEKTVSSSMSAAVDNKQPEIQTPSTGCSVEHSSKPSDEKFGYEDFWNDRIEAKKKDHSYRVFRYVERSAETFPYAKIVKEVDGMSTQKDIQVWCSNDYMGMSWHTQVRQAVKSAVDAHGVGAGGTRNISGSSPLHSDLEKELARIHQKEAALLFTSCYVANDTSLYTIARMLPGCHIYSDAGNHASMIQGIRTSGIPKHVFRHNDPNHLRELLKAQPKSAPKIVAFETVYSMSGNICPLAELLDVCEEFGALTFVDEVHAVGLYGKHGAGVGERDGQLHRMDMISGTLGKAFGNIGGYIASSAKLIDTLRSFCSGFIFTTSLPPTVLAGAKKAVQILASCEGEMLRARHQANVRKLREKLYQAGLPVMKCPSHILPIKVGDPKLVFKLSQELLDVYGIYVQPINYPTVARGQEMLRVAPTPHHNEQMMEYFVSSMVQLWKDNGLELKQPACLSCHQTLKKKYWITETDYVCTGESCDKYIVACA